jgi:hypothetical protein
LVLSGCCALVYGCSGPVGNSTEASILGQDAARLQAPSVEPARSIPTLTLPAPTGDWVLTTEPPGTQRADPPPVSPSLVTETGVVLTPDVQVCSPLVGIPLEELPQIVSEPTTPILLAGKSVTRGGFSYYRRGERLSIQGTGSAGSSPASWHSSYKISFPTGTW